MNNYIKNEFKIKKGTILVYRVYDIGEEIDLNKVESIVYSTNKTRLSFSKNHRKPIILSDAPISFKVDSSIIKTETNTLLSDVSAKVFDYGALSLCLQINIPENISWTQLVNLASELENSKEIDNYLLNKAFSISKLLNPTIKKASLWEVIEDYSIYFIESITGIEKDRAIELLHKVDIPSLILAENKENLAESGRKNILENYRQYSNNDLTIIDWNSAFIYDPSGNHDVCDVIEFSLTQLFELRYYDDLLDKKLITLYNSMENESTKRPWSQLYSKLSMEASQAYVEVSEFVERVDNSLKTVGDFYLATIFRLANTKFRYDDWKKDVEKKLNTLAQISQLFQAEVNSKRSHVLEITVILLIAFEIFSAMLPWVKR